MKENPLLKLTSLGQAIWLDFISRQIIDSGELQRLIDEDGLRGMTSNPSIFEKAIAGSHDYDEEIRAAGPGGQEHPGDLRGPDGGGRAAGRGPLPAAL